MAFESDGLARQLNDVDQDANWVRLQDDVGMLLSQLLRKGTAIGSRSELFRSDTWWMLHGEGKVAHHCHMVGASSTKVKVLSHQ